MIGSDSGFLLSIMHIIDLISQLLFLNLVVMLVDHLPSCMPCEPDDFVDAVTIHDEFRNHSMLEMIKLAIDFGVILDPFEVAII